MLKKLAIDLAPHQKICKGNLKFVILSKDTRAICLVRGNIVSLRFARSGATRSSAHRALHDIGLDGITR